MEEDIIKHALSFLCNKINEYNGSRFIGTAVVEMKFSITRFIILLILNNFSLLIELPCIDSTYPLHNFGWNTPNAGHGRVLFMINCKWNVFRWYNFLQKRSHIQFVNSRNSIYRCEISKTRCNSLTKISKIPTIIQPKIYPPSKLIELADISISQVFHRQYTSSIAANTSKHGQTH